MAESSDGDDPGSIAISGTVTSQGGAPRGGASGVGVAGAASRAGEAHQHGEAPQHGEARFRALREAVGQIVWSWSADGATADFDEARLWWERLTGQSVAQQRADPRSWLAVVHPDDRAAADETWTAGAASGTTYDSRYRVRALDGGWRYVRVRGVPVRNPDGTVREWIGTLDDVTVELEAAAEHERLRRMYETALSSTVDFVYLFDTAGRFTYVNKALLDLWGKDLSQAVGRNFHELDYPPELANRLLGQIREVVEHGRPIRDETPYTSDAKTAQYEYIFSPVFGFEGAVEAVAGSTREITDRKRAEEALRQNERRYRALVTATSDIVYRMSADWSYMEPLDGRELVASSAARLHDWMAKNVPPGEHARVREAIAGAISAKGPFELEHQVYRADGTTGWTFSRAVPILDDAGEIVEWFGTAGDVTRRKRAEVDLARVIEESERRKRVYETILSNTPDFAYVIGLDHLFLYANDNLLKMWGRTWDQAVGKGFLEIGYEAWHAEMHEREVDQVKATRKPLRGEVPFNGTFGRRIYDYIFVPIFNEAGEVEAIAGTTRDVTDRKEAEEALRDADRKKDDFIALLAHELRNPLAPIRNGLQVMRLAEGNPTMIAEARAMMERQLAHMVRLIDDLLDVSRITRNKMELRRARVTLADVVGNAVEAAGPAIQEAGHELTVVLPPEPIVFDADLTRLAQVFSNLLSNSAKYTPRGGRIGLTAERAGDEAVVTVRDTGIGIPAHALPTIFDMFSQVGRTVEKATGGLGIGLALVKGLVEMHGGTVTTESVEGAGSTFTVRLPMPAAAPLAADPGGRAGPAAASRRRVLIVDDNVDGAESMAMMLRLLGNEVTTAHDGLSAVATAETFRPEVILMDVGLPKLDGLEATRRIRAQAWGRTTTIIAVTGWGQENDRERSRQAGCNGHLVKPIQIADLETLIGNSRAG